MPVFDVTRTVLVLGGYGAVGRPTVEYLRRAGDRVMVAGRDAGRADVHLDVTEPGLAGYRAALRDVDVVVNLSGAEDVSLAVRAGEAGAAFVDVSADTGYLRRLHQVDVSSPVVTSVGLAPGLTNLLAWTLRHRAPIDIAVHLGMSDDHGAAATRWTWSLLGARFADTENPGGRIRNFTGGQAFDLPGVGRRRLLRADFADQHDLTRDLGRPVRTFLGLDPRAATAGLGLLTRVPGARRLPVPPHRSRPATWTVLARGADGTTAWAQGRAQSRATALITALAAGRAPQLSAGAHGLHTVLGLTDVPTGPDLRIHPPDECHTGTL